MKPSDLRVIACNYTESTSECSKGALAYVLNPNSDNAGERMYLLARSKGGRWIEKWEGIQRLDYFRFKTIPREHPLYGRLRRETRTSAYEDFILPMLNKTKGNMNGRQARKNHPTSESRANLLDADR